MPMSWQSAPARQIEQALSCDQPLSAKPLIVKWCLLHLALLRNLEEAGGGGEGLELGNRFSSRDDSADGQFLTEVSRSHAEKVLKQFVTNQAILLRFKIISHWNRNKGNEVKFYFLKNALFKNGWIPLLGYCMLINVHCST